MIVRLVHWRAAEAASIAEVIRAAGHQLEYDAALDGGAVYRSIRQHPPDVVVIDLSRQPSHGRELAIGLRGAKSTRFVPIVFLGGAPEKVEAVRHQLPDAVFTEIGQLGNAIEESAANRSSSPVVPAQMMERYAGRTVAQKLGIRENSTVALIDAPRGYASAIGELPSGVQFDEEARKNCAITLWFVTDVETFRTRIRRMRPVAAGSKLWVVWPKKAAQPDSGLSERVIRDSAVAVGLVDYKVCAVDHRWTAIALAVKKER
jgi:CheY-like chemotaxis protein